MRRKYVPDIFSVTARSLFQTRLYRSHPCERPGITLPPASLQSYRLHTLKGHRGPCRRLIIFFLVIFFAASVNSETVYKTVDEDGNIIFTDKPSEGSEEIKLKKLQTIKNPNPAKYKPTPKPTIKNQDTRYGTFLIANPADGSGLRSNAGNITISVSLEPPLRSGHQIVITLDGKEVSNGSASSASVQNVERGAHNISASVVDESGKQLKSTSSSFSLLRASR